MSESSNHLEESLITFPAKISIKIMGKNTPAFQAAVLEIVKRLIDEKDCLNIIQRPSKNGNYLAINLTAMFADRQAVDVVYQALTASSEVLMAL